MITPRRASGLAGPVALALLGAVASGCGNSETSTGSGAGGAGTTTSSGGGGAGGAGADTYTPAGCGFQVASRPEYTDWSTGKTDTAADPKIRWVRLGIGGEVAVGAKNRPDPSTSIAVAWQTDDGTLASSVAWGSSPDPKSWPKENRASGATWLTPDSMVNGTGAQRMHEVYICGLTPGATYYYQAGGGPDGGEVWSDVYSFTTAPTDADTPVKIAINGDARGQNGDAWRLFQKKVLNAGVTLQLFSGDTVFIGEDQGAWEEFLDLGWKDTDGSLLTLGQVLTLAANGNHDNRATEFLSNVVLPQNPKAFPAYAELFYSLDVGPAHIAVVDDSFFVSGSIPQEDRDAVSGWLDADLAAADANRTKVPWIITMHHHGPFSSSNHGGDSDVLKGRAFFVPLFDKYHVDMDVAGHDHNYERSKPLKGPAGAPTIGASGKDGTVYVLCAGAGAPAYSPGTSDFTDVSAGFKTGGAVGVYGFLTVSKTDIKLEAHELRPDGTDPQIDSYTITK